jgi:hypothetical protein
MHDFKPLTAGAVVLMASLGACRPSDPGCAPVKKTPVVFLVKANNDLVSFCTCARTYIGAPGQMDCPWCGCGWLFICPKCRKAFSFARAEEVSLTWEELAHNDLDGKWGRQPTRQDVEEWIGFMKILLKSVQVGKTYAYIDGWVFPSEGRNIHFEGMHSRHDLSEVPQFAALNDRAALEKTLDKKEYWLARRIKH